MVSVDHVLVHGEWQKGIGIGMVNELRRMGGWMAGCTWLTHKDILLKEN